MLALRFSFLASFADSWKPLADVLGIPILVLGFMYTCVQMRKNWLDSQKTKLEIARMLAELQTSNTAATPSEHDTSATSVSRRLSVLTRSDVLVFAPGFLLFWIHFYWSATGADSVTAIQGMLVSVVCILGLFVLVVLLAGVRTLSRMLIQQLGCISEMLLRNHRFQLEMLIKTIDIHLSVAKDFGSPQITNPTDEQTDDSNLQHDGAT